MSSWQPSSPADSAASGSDATRNPARGMRTARWAGNRGLPQGEAQGRRNSGVHLLTLYLLVAVLGSYAALDLYYAHRSRPQSTIQEAAHASVEPGANDVCSRLEGHLDASLSSWNRSGGDPWRQLKWIGEPAFCRVRGQLIEKIDAEHNFRRGYALRHASDVEDRTHILPWLYGSRVDLNARARRVYLDLGANSFTSSVQWFAQIYPCDFTEMHAFERDRRIFTVPSEGFDEDSNYAPHNTGAITLNERAGFPGWMLDRLHVYYKFVSHEDDETKGAVNITRFIKEELGLKAEDALVVKMDIEGAEWPILRHWMQDPEMVAIVDELFVEIHYDHSSMWNFHWRRFAPVKREEAKLLLAELRWKGFFVHAWP